MVKIIPTLNKQRHRLSKTEWQRQILEDLPLRSFAEAVVSTGYQPLRANGIEVLGNRQKTHGVVATYYLFSP